MRIHECYMCGRPVYPGHGSMFVRNDAKSFRYCSKKCRKLFQKKINPRRLQWSKHFRRAHGKELSVDSTFDFEKQRNTPQKYDRELYAATIQAMKKVSEIQVARQRDFYFRRMTVSLKNRKMKIRRDLKKNIDMHVAPVAKNRKELVARLESYAERDAATEKLQNASTAQSVISKKKKNKSTGDMDVEVDENN